jgi:uncharacterized protein (TIGR00156 family)
MKKSSLVLALALALPIAASAQYSGPSTTPQNAASGTPYAGPSTVPTMTVKQLIDTGKDDQHVTLRGFIVSHDGGEHYTFADDTGRIKVEIDAKHFPPGVKIDDKVRVEITGEFDKDLIGSKVEVDVKRLSVLR